MKEKQMKSIVRALIYAAAFLELSGDNVVGPDAAVQALEDIGYELQKTTREERMLLQEVLSEEKRKCMQPAMHSFLDEFLSAFGLVDESNANASIEAQNDCP